MNNKNKLGVLVCLVGLTSVLLANAQSAFKADGLVESTAGGFKFPDGTVQNTSAVSGGPYVVGGTGPAGGFVFHVTNDGLHGLEAAPTDQSTGIVWGCYGKNIVGANATAIGKGARNTDDILHGCETAGTAAAVADGNVSPSGYYDWYLPSKDELNAMYANIGQGNTSSPNVGGFASVYYWSSSELDASLTWLQNFNGGGQLVNDKDNTYRVRAVRAV